MGRYIFFNKRTLFTPLSFSCLVILNSQGMRPEVTGEDILPQPLLTRSVGNSRHG